MGKIAELSNARFRQFPNAPGKSVALNIEHHGQDSAEYYQLSGFHGKPHDGLSCVVIDCGGNNIVVASHDYRFAEEIQKGETLIFSYDSSGVIKGKILINAAGEIVVNDGTDFAVKYNALKTAFDQLKSDFDAHTHGGVTSGSSSTSTTTPSTADMTNAKAGKVKI